MRSDFTEIISQDFYGYEVEKPIEKMPTTTLRQVLHTFISDCKERFKNLYVDRTYGFENFVEPPIYKTTLIIDVDNSIIGKMHRLVCPICGKPVNRFHKYCTECGQKLQIDDIIV